MPIVPLLVAAAVFAGPPPPTLASELDFAVALADAGLHDLAEARLLAMDADDPLDRIERAIDGLAGIRIAKGLVLAARADAAQLLGDGGADAEELRARARAALEGARAAVEDGWRAAEEAADLDDPAELEQLVRFGVLRHAEATLELARLEPRGSLARGLRAAAAADAAERFLWEVGDASPWSNAAYLAHGRALLERADHEPNDASPLRARAAASLAVAAGVDGTMAASPYRIGVAERAVALEARLLRTSSPPALDRALATIESFRRRAAEHHLPPTPDRLLVDLEEARLHAALGDPERARKIVEETAAGARTVRALVEVEKARREQGKRGKQGRAGESKGEQGRGR